MSFHQALERCVGVATTLKALQTDGAYGLAGDGERAMAGYTKALTLLENVGQRRWVMEKLAGLEKV